jgi:hypothetical protein
MPANAGPTSRLQLFRPRDYDCEQIERAREAIKFAKKVLAESDPSTLFGWHKPEPTSECRLDWSGHGY